jgi:hypothetical protein
MWRKPFRIISICLLTSMCFACRGGGTIESTDPISVTQLNTSYEIQRALGKTPVEVEEDGNTARYLVERDDGTKQYLVLIDPTALKGKLDLQVDSSKQGNPVLYAYNQYFDELMRVHRLVLRGQFAEAKRLIIKTNDDYDLTYGTMILSGLIAVLENDQKLASEHFRMAKSLYPDDETLKDLNP